MDIQLYKHNIEAYEKVKEMFIKENICSVIHPTGTGKSYIALKWILDNKDKKCLYVTSQVSIINQIERTLRQKGFDIEKDFPNLRLITYQRLLKDSDIKAEMIVLDEFHRTGAPKWGKKVDDLLKQNPDAKVLGLSATPIRYLDKNKDMSEEIFNGNVASHITLPFAVASGILPAPTYITALYKFEEDIKDLEEKLKEVTDKKTREELEKKLKEVKRQVGKAENIDEIFEKYMEKKNGKYLVFCKDINHLKEMIEEAKNMFGKVNKNIEVMYIHSEEKQEENRYTLDRFHYMKNNNLKLLYSIGMLNEGVHLDDIDGVIMLRPTHSPILYQQQFGRALTTGDTKSPLVFDVVSNIECLKDINLLRKTVKIVMEKQGKTKEEIENFMMKFKIIDDYKKITDLISDLNESTTIYGWDNKYKLLKKYIEEHNGEFPKLDEPIIGQWLKTQKMLHKKGILKKEREELLNNLGSWVSHYEDMWQEKYELLKKYVLEHNNHFPLITEPQIGIWLNNQRQAKKSSKLKKEREELLDQLGNWFYPHDNRWQEKYELLKKYIEEHDGSFPPGQTTELGKWIDTQRQAKKNGKLSEEREEDLNKLGKWLHPHDNRWQEKYEHLKKYMDEHNGEFPVIAEPQIGSWLNAQRQAKKNGKLSKEREELLDQLGNWAINNDDRWLISYDNLKKYLIENNGRFPKRRDNSVGLWLYRQKRMYNNNELSKEKESKLNELGDWKTQDRKKVKEIVSKTEINETSKKNNKKI